MDWQQAILASVSKVKLGGVVGKVCHVLVVALIVILGLAYSPLPHWASILVILALTAACVWGIVYILVWTKENPLIAVVDGVEILEHQQLLISTKQNPNP